jgi:hypothetical protein
MDQYTRRIIGFGIHAEAVDGRALCRMFNRAIGCQTVPKYLSSDHDPLYRFHQWQANLRVLDVTEVKTVPYVPLSHPFIERLIGTIRREFLDHVLFWTAADLESKLSAFRLPGLLQQLSNSRGIEGTDSDRIGRIQRSQLQILSLAAALSRSVRNTNSGMSMNSPGTRPDGEPVITSCRARRDGLIRMDGRSRRKRKKASIPPEISRLVLESLMLPAPSRHRTSHTAGGQPMSH